MSSFTKNRSYPVYASDDNSGTFLSFRTTIAGPGAGSALVMIDQDIADLYSSVTALQEEGSSVETISFTYQDTDGFYVGGDTELKTKAILIFSIDDNSKEVETKLNVAKSGAKYLKRHDYQGNYINVLNSELVVNKQYLTYFDGEYYMLVGCVVNEGDASNMFVTGAEATERANIDNKDNFKTAFGKLRKWFSDFGKMAWKNSVANEDLNENSIADNKLVKIPGKTIKGNVLSENGNVANLTAEEVREMINVSDSADNTQAAIDSATEKDAIIDNDAIVIRDSTDNIIKRAKFSVIRAAIQTYFDALYSKISHAHAWEEITNVPAEFTPSAHTQAADTITGLATVATSGSYNDLENIPSEFNPVAHTHSFGNLADVPTSFAPSNHANSHKSGGSDEITPSDIGAFSVNGGTLDGDLDMDGNDILNIANANFSAQNADGDNISVLTLQPVLSEEDNSVYLYLKDEYNGSHTVGIQNVASPISDNDAANKTYVDNKILYGTGAPTELDGEDGSIWITYK